MDTYQRNTDKTTPEYNPIARLAAELRAAADRRAANGEHVTALLFRNEALRIESPDGRLTL